MTFKQLNKNKSGDNRMTRHHFGVVKCNHWAVLDDKRLLFSSPSLYSKTDPFLKISSTTYSVSELSWSWSHCGCCTSEYWIPQPYLTCWLMFQASLLHFSSNTFYDRVCRYASGVVLRERITWPPPHHRRRGHELSENPFILLTPPLIVEDDSGPVKS